MGEMFRSEEMSLCQLFIQPEVIYSTVAELGEIAIVEFIDVSFEENFLVFSSLCFTKRICSIKFDKKLIFMNVKTMKKGSFL
jgi:hypothetical protein